MANRFPTLSLLALALAILTAPKAAPSADGGAARWWTATCRTTAESPACRHDDGRGSFSWGPESRIR